MTKLYRFGNVLFMHLQPYLDQENIKYSEFASKLGVSEASVHRYANGERVPEPLIMQKIRKLTKDRVTADDITDFYIITQNKKHKIKKVNNN